MTTMNLLICILIKNNSPNSNNNCFQYRKSFFLNFKTRICLFMTNIQILRGRYKLNIKENLILIRLQLMAEGLYFTKPNDPNFLQAQVAISFLNLKVNTEQINKKYDPLVLLTPHGSLNQPNAILLYLVGDNLRGQTEEEKIRVFEWFEFFNLELHPLLKEIYEQISKERPSNKERFEYSLKQLTRVLEIFNNHLKIRTFFVGDSLSVVDISLATHLETAFKRVINEDLRKKIPNLARWFSFVRSTGPFLNVLGQVELCGKTGFQLTEIQAEVKKEEAKKQA